MCCGETYSVSSTRRLETDDYCNNHLIISEVVDHLWQCNMNALYRYL